MTINTRKALREMVEKFEADLEQKHNCSGWECDDCPLQLKEPLVDSWGEVTHCGWLLLKSATSVILRG